MFEIYNLIYKDIINIPSLSLGGVPLTVLHGASGCGKTTLLRLLSLIISPDSGNISYNGTPVNMLDPVSYRRQVRSMSQNVFVDDENIKKDILGLLKILDIPQVPDSDLEAMMIDFMLNKPLNEPTANLSGGEKQRLNLVKVMLLPCKVLLLDEPEAALDDASAFDIIKTLKDYAVKKSFEIIMVSHKEQTLSLADDIIEFSDNCVKRRCENDN